MDIVRHLFDRFLTELIHGADLLTACIQFRKHILHKCRVCFLIVAGFLYDDAKFLEIITQRTVQFRDKFIDQAFHTLHLVFTDRLRKLRKEFIDSLKFRLHHFRHFFGDFSAYIL